MSYMNAGSGSVVASLPGEEKAGFIRRTYGHLALAITAFALIEYQLISMGVGHKVMALLGVSHYSWLIVMGAYMVIGVIAEKWATSNTSRQMQYAGLGLYVVFKAIIISPLITMATLYADGVLQNAALMTGALVAGITLVVFTTRKDFSFLAPALKIGGMVAFGLIVASILFKFQLGTMFSGVMILFMAGCVLYTTSNVLNTYREDQHVAASLALFASISTMFWYIVQFLMSLSDD